MPNPDVMGREKILKVHMRKTPLAEGVEPRVIARGTPGFSGADLANLVNEAALLAARKGRRTVSMAEFEEAKDKVMLGSERRSMVMTDEEKRLTAYHEAGHAVVALHCPASDPIHKATIIPRGRALGMVMRLPEGDRISLAREKIHADLRVACGGRIAEELIFGDDKITTGASSDIRMVTDMARRMVTEWGMSEKLGFLAYSADEQEVFLGRSVSQQKNVADATASIIDKEVRRIVDEAYKSATSILKNSMLSWNVSLKVCWNMKRSMGMRLKSSSKAASLSVKMLSIHRSTKSQSVNHAPDFREQGGPKSPVANLPSAWFDEISQG